MAPLEVAKTARARSRGLLGRDGLRGALLLRPASSVHTIGMRFPIDVAHCGVVRAASTGRHGAGGGSAVRGLAVGDGVGQADRGGLLRVVRVVTMAPGRIGPPVWRARAVLEAEAGSFARWGLVVGVVLAVGPAPDPAPDPVPGPAVR